MSHQGGSQQSESSTLFSVHQQLSQWQDWQTEQSQPDWTSANSPILAHVALRPEQHLVCLTLPKNLIPVPDIMLLL